MYMQKCPACKGEHLECGQLEEMAGGTIERDVTCLDCTATYTVVYGLSKITNLVSSDIGMTAVQLATKYSHPDGSWGEHPTYGGRLWRANAALGTTMAGYWDWVVVQVELSSKESAA